MVAVSVLALGNMGYALAAREAVLSVLAHSEFDVYLTCDYSTRRVFSAHPRLHVAVQAPATPAYRPDPFLAKLGALAHCLSASTDACVIHLDADAVFTRTVSAAAVEAALGSSEMAMVEQTAILGSTMRRPQFLRHYAEHSLAFIEPTETPPSADDFRFFNSGLILLRREGLERFLAWAEVKRRALPADHRVGAHMIADQDYFQVWANNVAPGSCSELSWVWNHCPLWDPVFPQPEALVSHLSNFCNGPTTQTVTHLRALAGEGTVQVPLRGTGQVTFVVVTYNSEAVLEPCLAAADRLGKLVVIDNASTDRSVEIAKRYGARIAINQRNEGFASAANAGAALATTDALCFLNPDCLITDDAVDAAIKALHRNPRQLLVPDYFDWSGADTIGRQPGYTRRKLLADILQTGGHFAFGEWVRAIGKNDDAAWHWPIAACLFADRQTFRKLGGFDTAYFCYMEDVALGRKAAASGINTISLNVAVLHLEQASTPTSKAVRNQLLDRSRFAYGKMHYGTGFVIAALLLRKSLSLLRRLRILGAHRKVEAGV